MPDPTNNEGPRRRNHFGTPAKVLNGTLILNPTLCRTHPTESPRDRIKKAKSRAARTAEQLLSKDSRIIPLEPIDASDPNAIIVVKDASPRSKVAEWVLMRAEGTSNAVIAKKLCISLPLLETYIYKGCKEGWLKLHSPTDRMEHVIVPKIVDNVEHFIDAKDRTMTIEAAKGMGIFKSHQAIKVEGQSSPTMLALKIEMTGEPTKGGGNILGTPKTIDAGTVETE